MIWRADDPPMHGSPREAHLARRVHRLERMNLRRPEMFAVQLWSAKVEYRRECRINDAVRSW